MVKVKYVRVETLEEALEKQNELLEENFREEVERLENINSKK